MNFKRKLLPLLLLFSSIAPMQLFSQNDSACSLQISLLTCSPGEELYSTFGHTAIRVRDTSFDIVFNYGTFDFDDPDFLMKFVRGRLPYSLSIEYYTDFRNAYVHEKRGIQEQQLLLSCKDKEAVFEALKLNALEQNRYYKYQFLQDNCTTRAREIIRNHLQSQIVFNNILPETVPTFRELIHSYLDRGDHNWSKLGIDLLLGSRIDRKVTNEEAMFLPDNLLKGFDSARLDGKNLVNSTTLLLEAPVLPVEKSISPVWIFSLLLLLLGGLSFVKTTPVQTFLKIVDRIFFGLLGALGILFLFMWWGTDHVDCANNYNLLWALPFHFLIVFINWKRPFAQKYFLITAVLSVLTGICWWILPQSFNPAIAPVLGIIMIRAFFISKR